MCNKIADELYSLLNIKHTKTSPAHPQCNAQVEVFNKTLAKYLASFVNSTTLDWEQYIPAMMFSYNTSYHSTIMTTPFELLFGMKARTPSFPSQDVQHLHYGESFAAERLQILKQARLIAQQHTADKGEDYKSQFDKNAVPHEFKWLGPATIIETTDTNVKIKCANNKVKLLNVSHIKLLSWRNLPLKQGCTPKMKILALLSTLAVHLLHLIICPILQIGPKLIL